MSTYLDEPDDFDALMWGDDRRHVQMEEPVIPVDAMAWEAFWTCSRHVAEGVRLPIPVSEVAALASLWRLSDDEAARLLRMVRAMDAEYLREGNNGTAGA